MAYHCRAAQRDLSRARAAGNTREAWEITNEMRANGCQVSLDGLRKGKKRTCKHGRTQRGTCRKRRKR